MAHVLIVEDATKALVPNTLKKKTTFQMTAKYILTRQDFEIICSLTSTRLGKKSQCSPLAVKKKH